MDIRHWSGPDEPETEPLNAAVREHEVSTDWKFREKAELLHAWFDRFNDVFFKGRLPICYLQFERTRRTRLGHYRYQRNCVGARHEINLNSLYLGRADCNLLSTLLHEMVHEWQDLFGKQGAGNYHNEEFIRKCRTLGIFAERGRGYHVGYGDPFVSLLEENGVPVEPLWEALETAHESTEPGTSKLKKWRCGCTNIRAAVEVSAKCLACGECFRRAT